MSIVTPRPESVKSGGESFAEDVLLGLADAGPFVPPTREDSDWWDTYTDRQDALERMHWREAWAEYAAWSERHDRFGREDY